MAYAHHQTNHDDGEAGLPQKEFSGAHVSLGGVKYAVGAIALMMLGEKIKSPEQRYLVLAGLGALVGAIDTAWRDHVRSRQRAEKEACWRERSERKEVREKERD